MAVKSLQGLRCTLSDGASCSLGGTVVVRPRRQASARRQRCFELIRHVRTRPDDLTLARYVRRTYT